MLGMDLFTLTHVVISLVGIAAGLIVLLGMLAGQEYKSWNSVFLLFTILTSVTGFFFRRDHIMPGHILGVISLVDLAVALYALYGQRLSGPWRATYVVTATLALYFNFFVLINQCFQKIPATPITGGPLFGAVQGAALLVFAVAGWLAVKRFRKMIF